MMQIQFKPIFNFTLAAIFAILLSACGGGGGSSNTAPDTGFVIGGSVGDGPIINATVTVRDANGDIVATTTSDSEANYTLRITSQPVFPLIISTSGGTDLVTGTTPSFVMDTIVLGSNAPTANINPFSTLIVKTAQNMTGGTSSSNITSATNIILTHLSFGINSSLVSNPITTSINRDNIAAMVKASETLAEMIRRTRDTLGTITADDVIAALAADMSDGAFDGNGVALADARISAAARVASAQVLIEALSNKLIVEGVLATPALDDSISATMPSAPDLATQTVAATARMLVQARDYVQSARSIAPSTELTNIADVLDAISAGSFPFEIIVVLPQGSSNDLAPAISAIPTASNTELDAVNQLPTSNNPPDISGAPASSVQADAAYDFTPDASDPDSDPLTFSITNKPIWAIFSTATGRLSGTPTESYVGTTSNIQISVSDGTVSESLTAFSITVNSNVVDPGVLTITNSTPVNYAWTTLAVGTSMYVDRDSSFNYGTVPSAYIGYKVLQTANDDKASSGNNFINFDVNQAVTVYVAYDTLITNLPAWLSTWNVTGDVISGGFSTRRLYSKNFDTGTVVLGGNEGANQSMYTVLVKPQSGDGGGGGGGGGGSNAAPTISGTPATSVNEDSDYSFTPDASDSDGNSLTFSIVNQPAWASFNTTNGALTGTPQNSNVGTTNSIVISVSDGVDTDSLTSFSITVVNTNDAPTIEGTPDTQAVIDSLYNFAPLADDIDSGDSLTFSISNKPDWATFSTSTGALTGTPLTGDASTTDNIVISVTDGISTVSLPAFSLTVNQIANGNATISWTPPTLNEDDTLLEDLAGYKIHYGTTSGVYPNVITVNNPGIASYFIDNLAPNRYFFTVTAFDTSGNESVRSNIAEKLIE